jgi:4-hydroxybenzoate polyprenyltransferase
MLLLLALLPLVVPLLGLVYYLGLLLVGGLLAYEHYLVRPDDLSRVQQAFFHVNGIVSVGIFVLVIVQLLLAGRLS